MSLASNLVWYWDLQFAGSVIVDQHSGLELARIGTTTVSAGGAPDGGNCISFGAAAGKYQAASVAKTISYDDGYTANIWCFSAASSSSANWLISHRNSASNRYFQIIARVSSGIDSFATIDNTPTFRQANPVAENENVWQMMTLRDTGTVIEAYRNGVLVGTSSTVLGARATGTAALTIGGDFTNASSAVADHRGRLAMAGVWNEPLSPEQIGQLYNGGKGLRYAALVGGGNPQLINGSLIR